MKKGIICIFISVVLIATIIPVTSHITKNTLRDKTEEIQSSGTTTTWMKIIGGDDSDSGFSVQQTSDGGYIFTGDTHSYAVGGDDVWLVKTDTIGNEVWNKTFSISNNSKDIERGTDILQTSDNGYIIITDIGLIRTDENGNELWRKNLTNDGSSMCLTDDECYVIAGYNFTGNCLWIVKVDTDGNEVWEKNYGPIRFDGCSIKQTTDHGFITVGWNCIVKTDENGEKEWNITFAVGTWCMDVVQSNDGNYTVIGWKGAWAHNNTGWFLRIDAKGQILSIKNYPRFFTGYVLNKCVQTPEGGYLITGEADSELKNWGHLHFRLLVLKTDGKGNVLRRNTFGGGEHLECGLDIQETSDGGYIVLGSTNRYGPRNTDAWLIKTDSNGNVPFVYRFLSLFRN
ncbi:MAG: hypothetical protein MUC80_03975 [Candidatus Thermoplasmatota archaeon]|jgi:hypothetical protein|nr:hypothetical protein [Candidatus Thermoplasmatota archaeon]